jgi:3-oxoacyl-[acyl-carrier protein] reductase
MRRTLEECRETSPGSYFVECDLSQVASIELAAARVLEHGIPTVLVNNAGIVERDPLESMTFESLDRQLRTNLVGPIWLTRALLSAMRRGGCGRIINIGSISATLGSARQTAYNSSKWGLTGFTKSLAEELADSGLMTLVIQPGGVATDMSANGPFEPRIAAEDVARTVVYFALDAPLAHNGASIEMFGT